MPSTNLYWSSLQQFSSSSDFELQENARSASYRPRHRSPDASKDRRVLFCHDYKGGYYEDSSAESYTFKWWQYCTDFVYFAHHRVSTPPPDWIIAGHRHGSRVFGTLIFEHAQGQSDIQALLLPQPKRPASSLLQNPYQPSNPFREVSTFYADRLVDLAVQRGFDGWLINIEVPLGLQPPPEEISAAKRARRQAHRPFAAEHALALKSWLEYLQKESKARIGSHSQIIWYDATTFQGDLSWQCHLNHLNAPFAQACDALFLDYHWRADFLQRTGENLGRLAKRHPTLSSRASQIRDDLSPQDIMFGIDVFGRGQYGGGQYSSYKALEQICKQPQLFGVALFGFGWISEGEELGSSRSAQEVFDSERFFYTGVAGDPPASVHTWRRTCIQARREALDQSLAEKLQNGEIDDLPEPPPPGYDFDVPLPNLIKPLSAFLPAMPPPPPPPPPLSSDHDTPEFFTNFSQGSGPAFFVQGKQISGAWTNVALSFPQPDLLFANTHLNPYIRFKLDTADAWEGNVSLQLVTTQSCVVPLFTVSFRDEKMYTCHMVFKTEAGDIPNLVSANGASSEPREWHEMVADRVDAVGTGWSEASFLLHNSEKIKQIGVALKSGDVLRIGSMGVSSEWHFKLPRLISGPH